MAKICFDPKDFRQNALDLIDKCNVILERYNASGLDMSVRQVYYQLVGANEIENTKGSYKKIQNLLKDGRLAGLIDWDYIVDRTRFLRQSPSWDTSFQALYSAYYNFRTDKWARQLYRPEVWIEKDALLGVFQKACRELQVPVLSCRGYTSLSEMFEAGNRRFSGYVEDAQIPVILHFGDHDPSGIDMSRDIVDRTTLLAGKSAPEFIRLALNMNQVDQYQPPPNFAKESDSRAPEYVAEFGNYSWELDALEPTVLSDIVRENILKYRNDDLWNEDVEEENEYKKKLHRFVENHDEIEQFLDDNEL
jgi:hypothetical protein